MGGDFWDRNKGEVSRDWSHLGGIWIHPKSIRGRLSSIWEATGHIRTSIRGHLEGMWGHLGIIWGASGRHLEGMQGQVGPERAKS